MSFVDNDRWRGRFTLDAVDRWQFTIEAMADPFRSWLVDLAKRVDAGQDVASELLEGAALVRAAADRASGSDASALREYAGRLARGDRPADAVATAREERLVARARQLRLEVALDFAIQCSPDHPYVREHPEWFFKRPDGTIKYAENPPKKYQDVYPVNFYVEDPRPLWDEMKRIVDFWIGRGVTTFRVDNPHTKPVRFWEWLIRAVKDEHPEVVFLAEAFTRPKMMKVLAKAGFTQSYTYFTWRNDKQELIDYLTEITTPPVAE